MKLVIASLLAVVAANSFGKCYDVNGVINSTPVTYTGGVDVFGCAFSFPYPSNLCITGQSGEYLAIEGSGNASFTGTAELTTVPVEPNPLAPAGLAFTPLVYPDPNNYIPYPPSDDTRADLLSFTSQAILETRFRGLRGTLYTKDTGVITELEIIDPVTGNVIPNPFGGFVGQIVKVVGGDGDFVDATGIIGAAGQEVGGPAGSAATYTGTVCLPD